MEYIVKRHPQTSGWGKISNWRKSLKSQLRQPGQTIAGGGQNKPARLKQVNQFLPDQSKCIEPENRSAKGTITL